MDITIKDNPKPVLLHEITLPWRVYAAIVSSNMRYGIRYDMDLCLPHALIISIDNIDRSPSIAAAYLRELRDYLEKFSDSDDHLIGVIADYDDDYPTEKWGHDQTLPTD